MRLNYKTNRLMKTARRSFVLSRPLVCILAFWPLSIFTPAAAQSLSANVQNFDPVAMSAQPYVSNGENRIVRLWRQNISPPTGKDLLQFLYHHPGQTSFPNVAFLLVLSDRADPSKGQILWASYIYNDRQSVPRQNWFAEVGGPIFGNHVEIILAKSVAEHIELRAFSTLQEQNLGRFPVQLSSTTYDSWPRADSPLSILEKSLPGSDISGIKEMHVFTGDEAITIQIVRDAKGYAPVVFHFSLNDLQWSGGGPYYEGRNAPAGGDGDK